MPILTHLTESQNDIENNKVNNDVKNVNFMIKSCDDWLPYICFGAQLTVDQLRHHSYIDNLEFTDTLLRKEFMITEMTSIDELNTYLDESAKHQFSRAWKILYMSQRSTDKMNSISSSSNMTSKPPPDEENSCETNKINP